MRTLYTTSLLIFFTLLSQAQTNVGAQRIPASEKAIPALPLEVFKSQYPGVMVKSWYITHLVYWQNDVSSGWYDDWYGPRNVVIYTYEKANYFEVEFVAEPGELSRAIYNRYGYWYETRTKVTGLPKAVQDAFKTSPYSDWKRSSFSERIESIDWKIPIYRFQVHKGLKSRILRITEDGTILQDKSVR